MLECQTTQAPFIAVVLNHFQWVDNERKNHTRYNHICSNVNVKIRRNVLAIKTLP